MSEADKMLKELGFHYTKEYSNDNELVFFNNITGVEFSLNEQDKTYSTYYEIILNNKLISAINEKMKELGWLDELQEQKE